MLGHGRPVLVMRLVVSRHHRLGAGGRDHGLRPHQDAGERADSGDSVEPQKWAGGHRLGNKAGKGVAVKQAALG